MSLATEQRIESPQALRRLADSLKAGAGRQAIVSVCLGTGCAAHGAGELYAAFQEAVRELGVQESVQVKRTGCHGFCELGPVVVVRPRGVFYKGVAPEDAADVIRSAMDPDAAPVERLLYEADGQRVVLEDEVPFYKRQQRIALRLNGVIDPLNIEDYIREGGYGALAEALTQQTPESIIEQISASGLRGRGGGGYPTGRKWASCRKAHGDVKYVICNGDEGDPGAFMDRSIMEANPHAVLEGMTIGSYAIGAHQGFIYVRQEYPLAVSTLRTALKQSRERGLLGRDILGTGWSFDIEIVRGGGAFVCGESTALMASLEGRVGEPRAKHIHTVESGLWEKPTTLNNVETWANVPVIIARGAEWFASIGSE
ncbi:MAG: NADH dehydrogenase, partial [Planctomycetes bacterium SM23_32]